MQFFSLCISKKGEEKGGSKTSQIDNLESILLPQESRAPLINFHQATTNSTLIYCCIVFTVENRKDLQQIAILVDKVKYMYIIRLTFVGYNQASK